MYAEPVPVTTQELVEQTAALKALRARLMLTLDEMAAKFAVNRSTVWRWEHGAKPRPAHMRHLAKLAKKEAR